MKTFFFVLSLNLFTCFWAQGQYVTIPDYNFQQWLLFNGYGQCMNASYQLDTTCPAVINAVSVNCDDAEIHDLTGIQYFKNLDSLSFKDDSLLVIPLLSNSLHYLNCVGNELTSLHNLPNGLWTLVCGGNNFPYLSDFPDSLRQLWGGGWDSIENLPPYLDTLDCNDGSLRYLPSLPGSLQYLDCSQNQLVSLPTLDSSLLYLYCSYNLLTSLTLLPKSLQFLAVDFNQLTFLPVLPESLLTLGCSFNQLHSIQALPNSIASIDCGNNQLDSLPSLPDSLHYLWCGVNQLTSLPSLPNNLSWLSCDSNNLISLPDLPDSLYTFSCGRNHSLYCLPRLTRIVSLYFVNTDITCIPNYGNVTNSLPPLDSVPLCTAGNINNCPVYAGIASIAPVTMNIYPNPATDYAIVDYGFTDWNKPQSNLEICNTLGQVVYEQELPMYSGFQKVDVSGYATGVYMVYIKRDGGVVATQKLVKQ